MMVLAVGTSDPAFYDGRAHQDVEAAMIEIKHNAFEFSFRHLPVANSQFCFRHEFFHLRGDILDIANTVMHESRLARRVLFPADTPRGSSRHSTGQRTSSPPAARRAALQSRTFRVSRRAPCSMCEGMGVAVNVSASTLLFSDFIASLWRTPKRCSSSIITSPMFFNSRTC